MGPTKDFEEILIVLRIIPNFKNNKKLDLKTWTHMSKVTHLG